MLVLGCTALAAPRACEGLCSPPLLSPSSKPSSLLLRKASRSFSGDEDFQSGSGSRTGGDISRSRQRDREAKTLYDYLGASPKDSQEQLKIRYTTLAKTLHPDSNPDGDVEGYYYDLSEINAAWEILKDPIERKRYDRSLQTKEIAEGIESLVSMGIQTFQTTAIPWLQKTADTTVAAVDASTKAAQEVNEQAKKTYGAFELEQQIKMLEQKATTSATRASKLQKEIKALPTKKIPGLEKKAQPRFQLQQQQQQQPVQLSSTEAQRILKAFQLSTTTKMKPPPAALKNDMKQLADAETKHTDALRTCQSVERATQAAARKVELASKAEETALKRLEEAQRAFRDAKQNHSSAQDADGRARAEERSALQSSTKAEAVLQKTRDRVRVGLVQQQDVFLDIRAKELAREKNECETVAKDLRDEAKALRRKAKIIKKP